jgi:hypothetical protein
MRSCEYRTRVRTNCATLRMLLSTWHEIAEIKDKHEVVVAI